MTIYNWTQNEKQSNVYYLNCNTLQNAIKYNITDKCDYCITIDKQGRGKYFVYAEEHTSDDMYDESYEFVRRGKGTKYEKGEPYFTNLKAATLFAEGFAENFVQCQIDIAQEEMYKNDPGDMLPPPNFTADIEMTKSVQNYLYEQAKQQTGETIETAPEVTENISDIFDIDIIDQQLYADSNDIALDDITGIDIIDQQLYADTENELIRYYALFEVKDSFDFQIKSISQNIEEAMRQFYIYLGDMRVIISIHNIHKRAYQFTLK